MHPPDPRLDVGRVLLGHRLRDRRMTLGLTLLQAAERSGTTPSYLSEIERGVPMPSVPVLFALAETYGTLLTDLLEDVYPFGTTRTPRDAPQPPPDARRRPRP